MSASRLFFFIIILASDTLHGKYNYLCDFNSNFTTNTIGTWNFDSNLCTLSQTGSALSTFGAVAWLGENTETLLWNDYVIESVVNTYTANANSYVAIIFRAQEITNQAQVGAYYAATLAGFDGTSGALFDIGTLRYKSGLGGYETLDTTTSYTTLTNRDYTVRIEVSGNSFALYIDDNILPIFTSIDNTLTFGSIGFRVTYAKATFKSLYITLPTVAPTTSLPTTAIPTTALPTTVAPTTSNPSTSLPTTSIPTTILPTTSTPTTSLPTTSIPTTHMPTFSPTSPNPTERPTSTLKPTISPATNAIKSTIIDTKAPQNIDDGFAFDDPIMISLIVAVFAFIVCIAFIGYCCYREKSRNDIKRKEIQLEMEKVNQLSISQQSPMFFTNETDTKLKQRDELDDNEEMYDIDEDKRTLNEGDVNTNIITMNESDADSNDEMYTHITTAGNKKGFYARAISDYEADDEDQLNMKQGVIVFILEEYITESGWFYGIDQHGRDGWLPSNYLNKCDENEQIELENEELLQIELMNKCYNNIKENSVMNMINMDKYLKMQLKVPPIISNRGLSNDIDEMSSDEDMIMNKETTTGR